MIDLVTVLIGVRNRKSVAFGPPPSSLRAYDSRKLLVLRGLIQQKQYSIYTKAEHNSKALIQGLITKHIPLHGEIYQAKGSRKTGILF